MTTLIKYSPFANNSATLFRAWGKTISDAFRELGWVQTADTGQINWTTVSVPAVAGATSEADADPFSRAMAGYEIWRMNDPQQAANPVFVKIDYGSGWSYNYVPGFRFTLGNGSDGAGNLTNKSVRFYFGLNTSSTEAENRTWLFSGGPGRFQMKACHDRIDGNYYLSPFLSIEREHTALDVPGDQAAYLAFTSRGWVRRVQAPLYSVPLVSTDGKTTERNQDPGAGDFIVLYYDKSGESRYSTANNLLADSSLSSNIGVNKHALMPLVAAGIDGPIYPSGNIMMAPAAEVPPFSAIKVNWGNKEMIMLPLWHIDANPNGTGLVYDGQCCLPDCLRNGARRYGLLMRWE